MAKTEKELEDLEKQLANKTQEFEAKMKEEKEHLEDEKKTFDKYIKEQMKSFDKHIKEKESKLRSAGKTIEIAIPVSVFKAKKPEPKKRKR